MATTPRSAAMATRAFTSHGTTYAKDDVVVLTGYSDGEIQRLFTNGCLRHIGAVALVKAGTVSDADFTTPPPNGTCALDTTDGRLYVRAAVQAQQTITLANATGGSFTVTFGGKTSAAIAYNEAASGVQTKLRAMSSIGATGVSVAGSAGGPYTLTFTQGPWGDSAVATVTVTDSTTGAGHSVTPASTVAGGGWKYTALT